MAAKRLIPDKRKGKVARKKKAGGGTIKTKSHPEGRPADIGHEDRLAIYIKRTLSLKREGLYLQEIAEKIAEEFDLEVVPHIATVSKWYQHGTGAVDKDIEQLRFQIMTEHLIKLDKLEAKWMPLAVAQNLEITRWVRVEGELQPELDANATAEQIEATKQVLKIMEQRAKLLGLNLEKTITETGEGPGSLQELQIWLINQVNISTGAPNGQPIDIQAERLELRAGLEEVDEV